MSGKESTPGWIITRALRPGPLRRFVVTGIAITSTLSFFQTSTIVYLIQVIYPISRELISLVLRSTPFILSMLSIFMAWMFYYLWPLVKFIDDVSCNKDLDDDLIKSIQNRCLRIPYITAIVSPAFYLVGGSYAGWMVTKTFDLGSEPIIIGFLGGALSAFLISPLLIHSFHWLVDPILHLSQKAASDLPPAQRTGYQWLSVRGKLVVSIITLVLATTGYISLVGFAHNGALLKNMEKIEATISPDVKKKLESQGVDFFFFLKERMGNPYVRYITLLFIACIEALIVGLLASREISGPIAVLQNTAKKITGGDYEKPVQLIGDDELAVLAIAINNMMNTVLTHMHSMEALVQKLKVGIQKIDETANILAKVTAEQASGSTEQASAVQEASAIAEEIVATAKQIAERAKNVDQAANSTIQSVQGGENKLEDAQTSFQDISTQGNLINQAMYKLKDKFEQSFGIVEMIKDIATQTELIALNASLEAAGAGENGRRFAVVAQATRQLAKKSVEAAQEVEVVIKSIQSSTIQSTVLTEQGSEKVEHGGISISQVVQALSTISKFAGSTALEAEEITLSTQQQTKATEQLAAAVGEVLQVAKSVESGAHDIEAMITELHELAESLKENVEDEQVG